jgi:hypothetical protein
MFQRWSLRVPPSVAMASAPERDFATPLAIDAAPGFGT